MADSEHPKDTDMEEVTDAPSGNAVVAADGESNTDAKPTTDVDDMDTSATTKPEKDPLEKLIPIQQKLFQSQLISLHKLIATQGQLAGVHPLTGQVNF